MTTEKTKSRLPKWAKVVFALFSLTILSLLAGLFLLVKMLTPEISIKEDVSEHFISYESSRKEVKQLILTELKSNELIEKKYSTSVMLPEWQWLRVLNRNKKVSSSAVITVFCPATYYFYVDFDQPGWIVEKKNKILYVTAPSLQVKRPSIDTRGIKSFMESGYFVFNEEDKQKKLLRNLTVELEKIAQTKKSTVRESCRHSLAEYFIRKSLDQGMTIDAVIVSFADDTKEH